MRADPPLLRRVFPVMVVAFGCAVALIGFGMFASRPVQAQDLDLAISKTLRGSEVVQVGQILEFAIRITNTGTLAISELDLVDEFVGSIVAPVGTGPYAKPGDPPLSDTQPFTYDGAEQITWQLLGNGQELAAGESLEVIVRLRAVRPSAELTTVNRARIARAVRSDGSSGGGGSAEVPARPRGARLPMTKTLGVPAPVTAGLPITFTITITNDSPLDIVTLPLRDVYNSAALRFQSADPPPLSVDEARGVLLWDDLLAISGRSVLRPGESITVVTVYTALRDITAAVNSAEVRAARDEFGNDAELSQAQAPIRIVEPTGTPGPGGGGGGSQEPTEAPTEAPTATPTPFATAGPRLTAIAERTASASVPTATATLAPSATTAPLAAEATPAIPASLPNTAAPGNPLPWLGALALLALLAAWRIRR